MIVGYHMDIHVFIFTECRTESSHSCSWGWWSEYYAGQRVQRDGRGWLGWCLSDLTFYFMNREWNRSGLSCLRISSRQLRLSKKLKIILFKILRGIIEQTYENFHYVAFIRIISENKSHFTLVENNLKKENEILKKVNILLPKAHIKKKLFRKKKSSFQNMRKQKLWIKISKRKTQNGIILEKKIF